MSNTTKSTLKKAEKLTPQQKARLELQEVQTALQAPLQFGTDKFLINVNGKNTKIPSNKNSIIKYTLEQPIKLEIGDRITLLDSFVEERGLAIDTISIDEDIEEEMRFLYYMQGDLRNTINVAGQAPEIGLGADQEFAPYPSFYQDMQTPDTDISLTDTQRTSDGFDITLLAMEGKFMTCFPQQNYIDRGANGNLNLTSAHPVGNGFGSTELVSSGANGQYYYLMENYNPYENGVGDGFNINPLDQQPTMKIWYRPLYGSTTLKIPAGNYSVSALADLINKQLNGSITKDKTGIQVDRLTNKLHYDTDQYGFQQTLPYFRGTATNSFKEPPLPEVFNPDAAIIGADTFQGFQRRRGDIVTPMYFNPILAGNQINFTNFRVAVEGTPTDPSLTYRYRNRTRLNDATTQVSDSTVVLKDNWWLGNPVIGAFGLGTSVIANNYDRNLWNPNSSTDQQYYRFNNNFYLHLSGLRNMFEGDFYYGNKDFEETGSMEYYDPTFMPTLGDTLQCRQGPKGPYYRNNDVGDYNSHGYPEEEAKHPDDRKYFYGKGPEDYIFHVMFPCVGSMNSYTPKDVANFNATDTLGTYQQFAGTTAFNLSYDTGKTNRFSIENLHEPYKLPSRTPDNKNDTKLGGQQATLFNSPLFFETGSSTSDPIEGTKILPPSPNCGIYPIDSVGGIAVNNFSFGTVKETKVYKDLVADIAKYNTSNAYFQCRREKLIYDLFTKPYDEFFSSEEQAKEAWSKTLWNRIGYSYEQLGNVSDNLESIYTFTDAPTGAGRGIFDPPETPNIVKQKGIITHNQYNYTFIPSSSGLGVGNPYFSSSSESLPQNYGLRAYSSTVDKSILEPIKGANVQGVVQNNIHILCDSEPITADDFPSLNAGDNYFLIESDIVKRNAKDSKSNDTTIVGVMSKENATNDTIFSINPITFTVTEPKLLGTIEVRIKNPDGTLANDKIIGKNNGFVFQIEKSIKPAEIPMTSF